MALSNGSSLRDKAIGLLQRHGRWVLPASLLLALLAWDALVRLAHLPAFILPSPGLVLVRFIRALGDGSLLRHTSITLFEVLSGCWAAASWPCSWGTCWQSSACWKT